MESGGGAEEGIETVVDSKDLQQQSKARDMLTDHIEDRQLDSTRVQEAMASIPASAEADVHAMRLREKELASIKINAADIDIIANELELGKKVAERTLRENKDVTHMYKNQLQTYAQKNRLGLPEYACRREGPPHATRFSCKVSIAQDTYECQEFFTTLKKAENAVAKVALKALAATFVPQDSFLMYKNLLQELSQKQGFSLPKYGTMSCGLPHMPTFISTVEIKGETYQGESAKTKKLAEMNAAKVAYISIKERTCQPLETTSSSSKLTSTVLNTKGEDQESSEEKFVNTLVAPVPSRNGGSDTSRKRVASSDPHLSQQSSGSTLPYSEDGDSQYNSSLKINLKLEKPMGPANMVPQKKVCIQSRKLNMKLPSGTEVCSDDRWIATKTTLDETAI